MNEPSQAEILSESQMKHRTFAKKRCWKCAVRPAPRDDLGLCEKCLGELREMP